MELNDLCTIELSEILHAWFQYNNLQKQVESHFKAKITTLRIANPQCYIINLSGQQQLQAYQYLSILIINYASKVCQCNASIIKQRWLESATFKNVQKIDPWVTVITKENLPSLGENILRIVYLKDQESDILDIFKSFVAQEEKKLCLNLYRNLERVGDSLFVCEDPYIRDKHSRIYFNFDYFLEEMKSKSIEVMVRISFMAIEFTVSDFGFRSRMVIEEFLNASTVPQVISRAIYQAFTKHPEYSDRIRQLEEQYRCIIVFSRAAENLYQMQITDIPKYSMEEVQEELEILYDEIMVKGFLYLRGKLNGLDERETVKLNNDIRTDFLVKSIQQKMYPFQWLLNLELNFCQVSRELNAQILINEKDRQALTLQKFEDQFKKVCEDYCSNSMKLYFIFDCEDSEVFRQFMIDHNMQGRSHRTLGLYQIREGAFQLEHRLRQYQVYRKNNYLRKPKPQLVGYEELTFLEISIQRLCTRLGVPKINIQTVLSYPNLHRKYNLMNHLFCKIDQKDTSSFIDIESKNPMRYYSVTCHINNIDTAYLQQTLTGNYSSIDLEKRLPFEVMTKKKKSALTEFLKSERTSMTLIVWRDLEEKEFLLRHLLELVKP